MITFSLFAGVWSEIRLDQTPSQVKRPGDSVKMSCTMSGFDMTKYYIHWVRQRPGKALEWIGRILSKPAGNEHYKDSLKNKFSISLASSSNTVTLTGQNVQPEDTAVYYCAREPQ
uniref:Ig-like domain-containing protein n=1 Tax=Myripristis murdjan TaxID=586833 RepID=A0A667XI72_9TELE